MENPSLAARRLTAPDELLCENDETRRNPRMAYVEAGGLEVHEALHRFIEDEALPGTGVDQKAFWRSLGELIRRFGPRNATLVEKRERLQEAIDLWERQHLGQDRDVAEYRSFL